MSSSGVGRRTLWVTADQAISGASNVVLIIAAARLLDVKGFATVGILVLIYGFCLLLARSLIGIPVLIQPEMSDSERRDVVAATTTLGVVAAAALIVGGLVTVGIGSPDEGWGVIAIAVALPGLLIQDIARHLAFRDMRPDRAVETDGVWFGLSLVGFVALGLLGTPSTLLFLAIWGGTGVLAALIALRRLRCLPSLGVSWLRRTRRVSTLTLVEAVTLHGSALAILAIAGGLAGSAAVAGFTGSQLLARPFSMLQQALAAVGVTEVAQSDRQPRTVWRRTGHVAATTTAGCMVLSAIILWLPDSWGTLVLGDSWAATEPLLIPLVVWMLADALLCGPQAALRGLGHVGDLTIGAIVYLFIVVAAVTVGFWLGGTVGIFWGVAAVRAPSAAIWPLVLNWRLRSTHRSRLETQ